MPDSPESNPGPSLRPLRDALLELVSEVDRVKTVAIDVGLAEARIAWTRPAESVWREVLREAVSDKKLYALVERVAEDYPAWRRALEEHLRRHHATCLDSENRIPHQTTTNQLRDVKPESPGLPTQTEQPSPSDQASPPQPHYWDKRSKQASRDDLEVLERKERLEASRIEGKALAGIGRDIVDLLAPTVAEGSPRRNPS